jgi:hypothetical protein
LNIFFVLTAAFGPEKATACCNIAGALKNQIQTTHLAWSPAVSDNQHRVGGSKRYWQGLTSAALYLAALIRRDLYNSSYYSILSIGRVGIIAVFSIGQDILTLGRNHRRSKLIRAEFLTEINSTAITTDPCAELRRIDLSLRHIMETVKCGNATKAQILTLAESIHRLIQSFQPVPTAEHRPHSRDWGQQTFIMITSLGLCGVQIFPAHGNPYQLADMLRWSL